MEDMDRREVMMRICLIVFWPITIWGVIRLFWGQAIAIQYQHLAPSTTVDAATKTFEAFNLPGLAIGILVFSWFVSLVLYLALRYSD